MTRRLWQLVVVGLLVAAAVVWIRDARRARQAAARQAACLAYAQAHVAGVNPRAWCEP